MEWGGVVVGWDGVCVGGWCGGGEGGRGRGGGEGGVVVVVVVSDGDTNDDVSVDTDAGMQIILGTMSLWT